MSLIFVSGWAGFSYLYPNFSKFGIFITPFSVDFDEEKTVNFLKSQGGEILIGWSTGAHIILKELETISKNFQSIILIAPFLDFISFTKEKILDIMIENFKSNPEKVIKNFITKCGANYHFTEKYNTELMLTGLEFLKKSKIGHIHKTNNLFVIHGKKDKIVPFKESYKIVNNPVIIEGMNHYIEEKILEKYIYEITGKKIF
ncbi:hypothetical protein FHQ18_00880 [Deferribacter autotrophicus]|uniref:Alpha/beta hydrolase n=1 Tax=Deferribacter autotrophicus TaxID=500465 RepID=A0A5A8F797_9BACT|nr:hypothetical protein [Deferribacter autotrophicus]KAA0259463.1 hypothetical protein FHQ18_00880 [Deferribacter autotrophicus]